MKHREQQWTKRTVKEGLSIKATPDNMNLDTGAIIDPNIGALTVNSITLLITLFPILTPQFQHLLFLVVTS